jgi:hypothetical protein
MAVAVVAAVAVVLVVDVCGLPTAQDIEQGVGGSGMTLNIVAVQDLHGGVDAHTNGTVVVTIDVVVNKDGGLGRGELMFSWPRTCEKKTFLLPCYLINFVFASNIFTDHDLMGPQKSTVMSQHPWTWTSLWPLKCEVSPRLRILTYTGVLLSNHGGRGATGSGGLRRDPGCRRVPGPL